MSADDEEKLDSPNEPTEEVDKTEEVEVETDAEVSETEDKVVEHTEYEKKQYERAKKAEAELKVAKQKLAEFELKSKVEVKRPINSTADPDELRLIARGLSDDEIEQARVVSIGKNIPLRDAIKDPLFLSFQKDLKEQAKKEKARLGASKGSGQGETEKSLVRPGMTEDEHKEVWKKLVDE